MRVVFVDTLYWVASTNHRDQWYQPARNAEAALGNCNFITTEAVLAEFLNFFSEYGSVARLKAARVVQSILARADVDVVRQKHADFLRAITLFESRPDKGYSHTDCLSMVIMRERGITDVLTHDVHFTQEGFKILL